MRLKKLSAVILSVLLIGQATVFSAPETELTPEEITEALDRAQYSGEYQAFEQISEYVSRFYIDDSYTKDKIMADGAAHILSELLRNNEPLLVELLKDTLEGLDDYSEFYTAEEYSQFQDNLNHTFYGIGITMTQPDKEDYIVVSGYADGTDNAIKAGFKIGDLLYKVNGEDMKGLTMSEVREKIVGEAGTQVTVTVLRDGKEVEIVTKRVAVNAASVGSGILEGNIGYISIISFSQDTAEEFERALNNMRENKVKSIILDLRNNGGGLVSSAIKIAQSIVPKGKIIDVKYRDSQYDATYNSTLTKKEFDFAVLVNDYTASAAEILSSAIQDSGAGKLFGQTTYGKAVIQSTFPLDNGSAFKLTVGRYITRNGNEINHVGLTPDVYVENDVKKLDTSEYNQFDYKERTALGAKSQNVLAAKERLSLLGYYEGETENDVFDTDFLETVKVYQRKHDIFSYGILDIPTQKLIESEVSQIDVVDDKQLEAAYVSLGGKAENLYN